MKVNYKSVKEYLVVFSITSILSIGFTYPLVPKFGEGQIARGGDYYQFLWNFWYVKEALFNNDLSLLFTNTQYHPTGTTLSFHDLTLHWSILSVPLQTFMTRIQIFHLFTFLSFPLTALAQYYLLRKNQLTKVTSFLAGVLFAFVLIELVVLILGK